MEEVGAFGGKEAVEQLADALDECVDGASRLLLQEGLEFGEGELEGFMSGL